MAAICIGLGIYTWRAGLSAGLVVSGHVVFSLGAICLCLFSTAAVIIRQLIHRFTVVDSIVYPVFGYLVAVATFAFGVYVFSSSDANDAFVAGHVICGS